METQRRIQRGDADARRSRRRDRLVFGVGIQIGDVALAEAAQGVVIRTAQDLGELAATVTMRRHAPARTDLQHDQAGAAGAGRADVAHSRPHPAPLQPAPCGSEIRLQRRRQTIGILPGRGIQPFGIAVDARIQIREHARAQLAAARRMRRAGIALVDQNAADRLSLRQASPALRAGVQVQLRHRGHLRRQRRGGVAHQRGRIEMVTRGHGASTISPCRRKKARRRWDFTVPSGMPSSSAMSWWLRASK